MSISCNAFSVFLIFSLSLAGCTPAKQEAAVAFHDIASVESNAEPMLRSGDRVQVSVFGEQEVTGAYDVTNSGFLQLPLAGSISAAGRTTKQLERLIATALRQRYIRDPKVTVAITSLRPFYVLGEVEKPGEYPYRTGLNIWRALAIAGGQTYRASASSVLIQHAGETRMAEYDLARDVSIQPGDLIRVPERWF